MRCSMQDIFERHFDDYARQRSLHPRELRAAWCIRHCFTPAMGCHLLECPNGHFRFQQCHACRHRSCPRCANAPRQAWIDAELQRLLPCPHFHAVFTLPHELLPLWAFNRQALANLLMSCVRESLMQLLACPRFGGIVPGLLMALHTWGRDLSYHPHVHCLVSAGGLDSSGHFKPLGTRWLLPLPPLRKLFCGKLLAGLQLLLASPDFSLPPHQPLELWLRCIRALYRKHWNIEIQPPYSHASGVALYLARYIRGGPVPADRPLSLDRHGLVRMPYFDHRSQRRLTLCLPAEQFIQRILWHAPPPGLHLVRRAGLYAAALREQHALLAQQLRPELRPQSLPPPQHPLASLPPPHDSTAPRCPRCNAVLLPASAASHTPARDQISLDLAHRTRSTAVPLGPTTVRPDIRQPAALSRNDYSRLRAAA